MHALIEVCCGAAARAPRAGRGSFPRRQHRLQNAGVRPLATTTYRTTAHRALGTQQAADLGALPAFCKIVEVGPRDGLQNERKPVDAATKIEFIDRLGRSGLSYIEATSFVSAKWVPQMGDAAEVMKGIERRPGVTYAALTPNQKGLEAAIECGTQEVAIFGAASDAFSMKNINCNVQESLERFKPLMALARQAGVRVRGYVSCVLGCPYQGHVAPDAVGFVAQSLLEMGCYEVSLGDTIGVGNPLSTRVMLEAVRRHIPLHTVAVHFHNTYGCALANVLVALQQGVAVVDSSVAGLGGCPYAKGASGNVATEDLVYMLHGIGVKSNVDLDDLITTGQWMCDYLGKSNQSKVAVARLAARAAAAASRAALADANAALLAAAAARGVRPPDAAVAYGSGVVVTSAPSSAAAAAGLLVAPPQEAQQQADAVDASLVQAVAKARAAAGTARVGLCWPQLPEELFPHAPPPPPLESQGHA